MNRQRHWPSAEHHQQEQMHHRQHADCSSSTTDCSSSSTDCSSSSTDCSSSSTDCSSGSTDCSSSSTDCSSSSTDCNSFSTDSSIPDGFRNGWNNFFLDISLSYFIKGTPSVEICLVSSHVTVTTRANSANTQFAHVVRVTWLSARHSKFPFGVWALLKLDLGHRDISINT